MLHQEFLGHTPDDQPVSVIQFEDFLRTGVITQIEIGRHSIDLDHLDPELIPALRRSLQPVDKQVSA
jgi:hypothetical protein